MAKACPSWIWDLLLQLRRVEEELGHLPPSKEAWRSQDLQKMQRQMEEWGPSREEHSQILFSRLAKALASQGFSPQESVDLINEKMSYPKGPPYCDLSELKACL